MAIFMPFEKRGVDVTRVAQGTERATATVSASADAIMGCFSCIDVTVNNAAIYAHRLPEELPVATWRREIGVVRGGAFIRGQAAPGVLLTI